MRIGALFLNGVMMEEMKTTMHNSLYKEEQKWYLPVLSAT